MFPSRGHLRTRIFHLWALHYERACNRSAEAPPIRNVAHSNGVVGPPSKRLHRGRAAERRALAWPRRCADPQSAANVASCLSINL